MTGNAKLQGFFSIRRRPRALLLALALAANTACTAERKEPSSPPVDGGSPQADGSVDDPPYLNQLSDERAFDALAAMAMGGELKYLARAAERPAIEPLAQACYFQNARLYPWHLQFLQRFSSLGVSLSFDLYRELVMRESTRRMWGGTVRRWPGATHPITGLANVITFDIYAEPGGLTVEKIAEVSSALASCAPFANQRLAFVATGADQEALVRKERASFAARGVAALLPGELDAGSGFTAYTRGEGYGYLRLVPRGEPLEDYGPRDVVAVESVPQDISIVAGLLSQKPQNELGHVNLRLREKGIPNASVAGLYDDASLLSLDGKLVHIVVSDTLSVREARIEEAEPFWLARRPAVRTPTADLTRTALLPLRELRFFDAQAYGAKCANLGELTHVLPAANRPDGFGIPFAHYRDFARAAGLESKLDALIAAQSAGGDATQKRAALKALRDMLRATPLDAAFFASLRGRLETTFGPAGLTTYLRFRSSTNVEDLDSLTGAGLYDSKSGCMADDLDGDETGPSACLTADKKADLERRRSARLEELRVHPDRSYLLELIDDIERDLSEEKTVADALRKVWASLWNERAFDERAYYGIDQRLAFMGVAVHPTFSLEQVNAVVVSNLPGEGGAPLYRVNSQVGELSVVTPEDPGAVAEVLTFRRSGEPAVATDIRVLLASSLVSPPGREVWPREKLLELSQLLFVAHDHFARVVYPTSSPLALDFEVKLERGGEVSIKQVRPYVNTDP